MRIVNISCNRITDNGVIAFVKCLKTNTTLIKLGLSESSINSEILQSIAQAIKANNKHSTEHQWLLNSCKLKHYSYVIA